MIEIRYSRSQAGLDNIFDLFHINDYIPVPISEQHSKGTELRFYLSLFKRFDILSPSTTGTKYIWNTHFTCQINGHTFKMIYDNEYDTVSFAVDEEFIEQRRSIAEAVRSLVEKEGLNTKI